MWVFFLKEKSEAYHHFKIFKNLAESECGERIKCFRTDRGGEFNYEEFKNFCDMNGIKRHFTAPYSPQQTEVVERKNRTIMSFVKSMLKEKRLPIELWAEAVNTCVYVLNQSFTKILLDSTPYEKRSGRKPSIDHLRVFGSVVHVKTAKKVSKLEDKSSVMILIGHELGTKAYRCLDPKNFKVTIGKDVIFEESQSWDFSQQRGQRIDLALTSTINLVNSSKFSAHNQDSNTTSIIPSDEQRDQDQSLEEDRPKRYKSIQEIYDETQGIEEDDACFFSRDEPTSYIAAMKEDVWRQAMKEELEAIERNSTWELVKLLEKCKSIGVKWIYKIKRNVSGEITRYKARLVAKGFSQMRGIDYEEVLSPVVKAEFIWFIIAMAAQFKWNLHHLDVKSTFLNGYIKEDIYVEQPEGFVKEAKEDFILKLRKALYGLKEAPRAWNSKLDETLKLMGFIRSINDQAMYTSNRKESKLWVGVYVDDLIITRFNTEEIESFKLLMKTKFEMNDFGLLNSYLGIQVIQEKDEIKIFQTNYALKGLNIFNMSDCNASKTPMECRLKLNRDGEGTEVESTLFRKIIGFLRYLTLTRPDLVYSLSYLSRFMNKPYSDHVAAAKQIVRYVKDTTDYGLVYKSDKECELIGYCDSDYAGDLDDRKSTSCLIFFYGSKPIAWSCCK